MNKILQYEHELDYFACVAADERWSSDTWEQWCEVLYCFYVAGEERG